MSMATPGAGPSDWSSLRRVSYTFPTLRSFEDDPLHRYMPDESDSMAYALPVLDLPARRPPQPPRTIYGSALPRVQLLHAGAATPRPRPMLPWAVRPRHKLPVTALALDPTSIVAGGDTPASHDARGLLYTAGKDGLVCAWELDLDGSDVHPQFHQSVRAHRDWVTAMVLCHGHQMVITASSDCTVKAWDPNGGTQALAPREVGIHKDYVKALACAPHAGWVASGSLDQTISLWDVREARKLPLRALESDNGVYSLGCSASGTLLASGAVDRAVRGWDPRVRGPCFDLVGHQDNVRALLMSPDGRLILTGSSDTTIKLWDIGERRCVHTFTHHDNSVWSLFSADDNFSRFYSGDRDGWLCKVDWDRSSDAGDGDCIVLARQLDGGGDCRGAAAGIQSIVAYDDQFVWTSTDFSATIRRWGDVPSRASRARAGAAEQLSAARDGEDITPRHHDIPLQHLVNLRPGDLPVGDASPLPGAAGAPTASSPSRLYSTSPTHWRRSRHRHAHRRTASRSFSLDKVPLAVLDAHVAYAQCDMVARATPMYVAPQDEICGDHGILRALLLNDRVHALSIDTGGIVAMWNIMLGTCIGTFHPDRVAAAGHLHFPHAASWLPQDTPCDTLDMIMEIVQGDGATPSWCMVDSAAGAISVHIDEARLWAAEMYVDELHRSPLDTGRDPDDPGAEKVSIGPYVLRSLFHGWTDVEHTLRSVHGAPASGTPQLLAQLSAFKVSPQELLRMSLGSLLPPESLQGSGSESLESLMAGMSCEEAVAPRRTVLPVGASVHTAHDASALCTAAVSLAVLLQSLQAPQMPSPEATPARSPPSDAGTVFLGNLRRTFTHRAKPEKNAAQQAPQPAPAQVPHAMANAQHVQGVQQRLREAAQMQQRGAPLVSFPECVTVAVVHGVRTSEHQRIAYLGTVKSTARDAILLEMLTPLWLQDVLFSPQPKRMDPPRIRMQLRAWRARNESLRDATIRSNPMLLELPVLPAQYLQLNTSRIVRISRVQRYVMESFAESNTALPEHFDPGGSRAIELLCNGVALPSSYTLGQCLMHCWKSPGDLLLDYRLR
ncbi:hypothetical protein MSPP1_000781 [Malassezia sp. CBS 17886]|nr:hypothetical protein MSPP1_000781 [Malassezia sp. CBS 17886]